MHFRWLREKGSRKTFGDMLLLCFCYAFAVGCLSKARDESSKHFTASHEPCRCRILCEYPCSSRQRFTFKCCNWDWFKQTYNDDIYIYILTYLLTYSLTWNIYMYMIYNDSECSARPHGGMADLGGSLLEPRAGLSITTGSRPRAHLPMQWAPALQERPSGQRISHIIN